MKPVFSMLLCGCLCLLLTLSPAKAAYNASPTIEGGLYHTLEDVPVYASVKMFDPDGDDVSLKVCLPPEKGSLKLEGRTFIYTPYPGSTGEDSFQLAACDPYGNQSAAAYFHVSIEAAAQAPYFADMNRHPYEYSAIQLVKSGVISGEEIGSRRFFYPERSLTRGEYLVMLLSARGWDQDLPICINTGLTNDTDIPLWLKPYVKRAIEKGIVTEDTFDTQKVPTRAEAVVLCSRAAQIQDILKYNLTIADLDKIPSWAMESYLNLAAYRILDLYDGYAYPNDPLDRGYSASLIWQLYQYSQSRS